MKVFRLSSGRARATTALRPCIADGPEHERHRRYAYAVLARELHALASMQPDSGRNDRAFRVVCRVGRWVHHGIISRDELTADVLDACTANASSSRYHRPGFNGAHRRISRRVDERGALLVQGARPTKAVGLRRLTKTRRADRILICEPFTDPNKRAPPGAGSLRASFRPVPHMQSNRRCTKQRIHPRASPEA